MTKLKLQSIFYAHGVSTNGHYTTKGDLDPILDEILQTLKDEEMEEMDRMMEGMYEQEMQARSRQDESGLGQEE